MENIENELSIEKGDNCTTCTHFNGDVCSLVGHKYLDCTFNNRIHYDLNIKYCGATKQYEIYMSGHKCNVCGQKH